MPPSSAASLDRTFGALPMGKAQPELPDWIPPGKARTIVIERPVPQSAVRLAMPGVSRHDPDWYPALVLAHILGGGQQSRLFTEVREKRGLAYSVSTGMRTSAKAALLTISTGSANEHVAEALRLIRVELARMRDEGVGAEELPTPRPISAVRSPCRSIRRAPSRACCTASRSTTCRATSSTSAPRRSRP
ncbi:MAG: insulinase family protein [Hyphomicrobium sp.]